MKKISECGLNYGKNKLWNIRKNIVLCSLYINDYDNKFNYDNDLMFNFFEGYCEYLGELMEENIKNYNDSNFFDYLPQYDNKNNLWNYYYYMLEDAGF